MSTATLTAARTTTPLRAVRDALDHLRDEPAPLWAPGSRARLAGWVAGSMVAWTVAGVAATAALGALVGLAG